MIYENDAYRKSIEIVLLQKLDYSVLEKKRILITGGTGLIGSVLVDMLCLINEKFDLRMKIILVSRNRKYFEEKFYDIRNLEFIEHNMTEPFEYDGKIDYAIHLASNTHPNLYATKPIETIETNILGTISLLNLCAKNAGCRFVNISSVEIYGENKSDKLRFDEMDCGYIDCNELRSGYNESKRLSETLCQAYRAQYGVDFVTARLCRCYGPTLRKDDSKAFSQFLFRALNGDDIVLKSDGEQFFSYIDVFNASSAILFIMLKGSTGNAYNIADEKQDIKLKDLAALISKISGVDVIFDLPTATELRGFSKSNVALLDSVKLKNLGWKSEFGLEEGIQNTISIMKEITLNTKEV